jgi:peptidoglycan hydrolase-like protein with peptidoglycan-binding domain
VWFFAIVVLAALVFLSIKTVFNTSAYAKKARKFTKPGFDEQVLEPLYYAFNDETSFDSSLNGAFNDDEINNWRNDLRKRRIFMWIFIGTAWVLILFSLMVPKSPRFEKFSAPVTDKIETVFSGKKPKLIQASSLKQGDRGEDVKALQRFLKAAGYTKNNPDGDYGPGTAKAVSAFQLKAGLDITGEADHKTIKAVNRSETARALAAGETPPPAPKEAATAPAKAAPAPAKATTAPKTTAPASTPAPAKTAEPSKSSEGGITLDQLKAAAAAAKKNNE